MSNMAAILKFKMAATRGRFRVLIEKVIIQGSSASVPSFVISPQSEIFCHIFRLSRCTTSILLERLSDTLDSQMRQERAGFRRGRLCNDEVFSLRQILEKVINVIDTLDNFDNKTANINTIYCSLYTVLTATIQE